MRFWIGLILASIGISALLTFISEYQGVEFSFVPTRSTVPGEQPQPEFVLDPQVPAKRQGYTVELRVPPSEVGKLNRVAVRFKNQGEGPLEISFLKKSCGCANVYLDQQLLKENQPPLVKGPGQPGELVFEWKPEVHHLDEMKRNQASVYRYGFELVTNERKFTESLKFEIITELRAAAP
jgi:hypothetical protein